MPTPRCLKGILTGILTGALALSALPDADTPTADVIVRGHDVAAVAAAVTEHGGTIETELSIIGGVAADVPTTLLAALEADARTLEVSPDAAVEFLARDLDQVHRGLTGREAAHLIGGRLMEQRSSFDGTGIDVAVLDTGIDTAALPTTEVVRGVNVSFDDEFGDGYGHGTAMAGIVAGETRFFQGVATDARLVDVKVADSRGVADVSQILAGIDWVVSNRETDGRNIRVLSMSFGIDGTNPAATSPLAHAVEAAWRHGITVVAAAGNHGDAPGRLASPAISPWVIAVGAADLTDVADADTLGRATVPDWSAGGDGVRNPDLVAPGRSLLGGRASGSAVETGFPEAHEGDYVLGSGTSQATAFTAGVVAAMLEADPTLTPDRVKGLLVSTAQDLDADATRAGAGVLDLGALFPKGRLTQPPTAGGQDHPWSDGTGSLDGERGRFVLEDADGNRLTGEHTVIGPFDRDAWLDGAWAGSAWSGSTWTGSTWTGSTWTGSTWTNVRWGE